jgi:hypothetical protein
MADTFTTRLSLTKPEVGASTDTWGTKLNANFDSVDGLFDAGPALKVVNGGTGATTAGSARTNLGLGTMATQDAGAVAITGGSVVTGSMQVTAATPVNWFYETGASADEKYWRLVTSGGTFYLQTNNDALSGGASPVAIDRTGTTVDSITLTATTVAVAGALTVSGSLTVGGALVSDSGSFTATLASATSGGTTYATGTAYWARAGKQVTLTFPASFKSGSLSGQTFAFVRGLPAGIRSACTTNQTVSVPLEDENTYLTGLMEVFSGSVDYMRVYTASGTYGFSGTNPGLYDNATITYRIAD